MKPQTYPMEATKIGRHKRRFRIGVGCLVFAWLLVWHHGYLSAQSTDRKKQEVKNLWPDDITIEALKPTMQLNPAYQPLWLEALRQPETDLKQEIVATLERIHRQGFEMSGLASEIRVMVSDRNHHTLNMALASLLVAIDDQDSAELLFGLLKPGRVELAQVIEPALAEWDYQPMRDIWDKRLSQEQVRRTLLLLAIDGLKVAKHGASVDRLIEIATDQRQATPIRISAARAAGAIRSQGLAESSRNLIERASPKSPSKLIDRLCAVALLAGHDSDDSNKLLQQRLLDDEAAVAGAAWKRLLEIDPALAVPFAKQCLSNSDPVVRIHVVTALREQPSLERIEWLGQLMDDRHPGVRIGARFALVKLAAKSGEFDERIRSIGMEWLDNSPARFRGVEQALILLAALDHKPAAELAVELLYHDQTKVRITAAWCLRILQVKIAFPKMFKRANEVSEALFGNGSEQNWEQTRADMHQLAHLFDAFGQFGFRESDELLRLYVPKNHELSCRPAAITALGKLHVDDADSDLIPLLVRRMHDQVSDTAESPELCATCAVALGRMNAQSALKDIERYYDGTPPVSGMHYAAAWAIRELTGREFPDPVSPIVNVTGFSLEPIGARLRENVDPSNK